jgi:RNA polymerase sigma factor (sigma-70 family)
MTDSQTLLSLYAQTGSESAFRELVSRYIDLVYSTACRLVGGHVQSAQDVAQTVFVALADKAGTLPKDVMLGGWLHQHTRFAAGKLMRTERRRQLRERQAAEMNAIEDHSESNLARVAPVLDEAIGQLDAEDRTAILLRFFERKDFRGVGDALGSSEDAARKRVDRALEKLHVLLKHRAATLSAAALGTALATEAVTAAPAGLAGSVAGAALASAAAGGGIAATIAKLVTMTKLKFGVLSVLAVACLVVPLVIQNQSQARLREENQALRQQTSQLAQVAAENERLSNLVVQAMSAESLSRAQMSELLRLRGEVGVLRRQNTELKETTHEGKHDEQTGTADSPGAPHFGMHLLVDAQAGDGQRMTNSQQITDAATHKERRREEVLYVQKTPLLDLTAVASACLVTFWQTGGPEIDLTLTPQGASQLAKLTRENIDKRIAITFNGQLYSAPVIRAELTSGKIPVMVPLPEDQARELVQKINESASRR